jgi:carbamoyltransferase
LVSKNLLLRHRVEQLFRDLGRRRPPPMSFGEHHLSHAAAAFHPSPFESAAILTIDGIGEWATASVGLGIGHRVDLLEEQRYPNSLGLLYSLVTLWCGFEPNDGEYKLMGLAPLGHPSFADALRRLATVHDDGSVTVDARLVGWWGGDPTHRRALADLLGGPPRRPDEPVGPRDADLARSMQDLIEEVVLRMATRAEELTGMSDLCMAGGVTLNCAANGRLLAEGPFDRIWVQPAAGDAGSAVGAAMWYWHDVLDHERDTTGGRDRMSGAFLGPAFDPDAIAAWLEASDVPHRRIEDRAELCRRAAAALEDGQIIGWFQGRMEFGPRALGHRSILADARSPRVHRELNLHIKGRESFRPFAPAVLASHAAEWFALDGPSPYMLFTFPVAANRRVPLAEEPVELTDRVTAVRSQIPACTHVDLSARVQTVDEESNPRFHQLLAAFHDLTGCPVLLNTSFNVAGEPIVCTPDDALTSAQGAGLDQLILEDCVIDLKEVAAS